VVLPDPGCAARQIPGDPAGPRAGEWDRGSKCAPVWDETYTPPTGGLTSGPLALRPSRLSERAARSAPWTSRRSQRKGLCSESWPSSPTSVISWHCAARMGVEVWSGATPRAARGSGGRVAWRGPRCHRRVDQCCGAMVGASDVESPLGVAHAGPSWTSRNGSGDRGSRSSSSCTAGRWCAVGSSVFGSQVLSQRCRRPHQIAPALLRRAVRRASAGDPVGGRRPAAGSAARQPVGRMDMRTCAPHAQQRDQPSRGWSVARWAVGRLGPTPDPLL
jgi:hypothetical protein